MPSLWPQLFSLGASLGLFLIPCTKHHFNLMRFAFTIFGRNKYGCINLLYWQHLSVSVILKNLSVSVIFILWFLVLVVYFSLSRQLGSFSEYFLSNICVIFVTKSFSVWNKMEFETFYICCLLFREGSVRDSSWVCWIYSGVSFLCVMSLQKGRFSI